MHAFKYIAHGGRLTFFGLFQGDVTFNDPEFHRREVTLLASRNALPEGFTSIIKAMEDGAIDTRPRISHRVAFDNVITTFEDLLKPESNVIEAVIEL